MFTTAHISEPTTLRATRARGGVDPDGDVLGLAGNGDVTSALQCMMQRHGAAVHRYCYEALRDAALADDVYQQVFIEAFRDLPRFAGRSPVRIWLFSIARHQVLDAARARCRTPACIEDTEDLDIPDPGPSLGESLDDARLREALVGSLDELSELVRTAVLLRYQQGFTFEEMAKICSEKPCTLRARVVRALPVLRERIESRIRRSCVEPRLDSRDELCA